MTPTDPGAVMRAALAARDSGRTDDGVVLVHESLKRFPRHAGLWQVLGLLHRQRQNSAAALHAYQTAAELNPDDPKIAHGLARVALEAGRPAVLLFDQALGLSPSDGSILIGRAAAQVAEGNAAGAIAQLSEISSANPVWLEGLTTLARLRWAHGARNAIGAGHERAIRSMPHHLPIWLDYIKLLIHAELYGEASEVVDRARRSTGDELALLPYIAICASELGQVAAADVAFRSLQGHDDVAITERHMRHLLRTGRHPQAVDLAEPWLNRPDAQQLWPYIGLAWRATGDRRRSWLEGAENMVGIYDLPFTAAILNSLAARLRELHNTRVPPLGQSVRGGTQTDGPLFALDNPHIQAARSAISAAVEQHVIALDPADATHPVLAYAGIRQPIRFAGSWSVRLTAGGRHAPHTHPLGWFSSAFYVALPGGSATAEDSGNGSLQLGMPPEELGLPFAPTRLIEPRPGRLVLFPSTMWHGTTAFGNGERISIAFDVARPVF
jgi:hypothetical protein